MNQFLQIFFPKKKKKKNQKNKKKKKKQKQKIKRSWFQEIHQYLKDTTAILYTKYLRHLNREERETPDAVFKPPRPRMVDNCQKDKVGGERDLGSCLVFYFFAEGGAFFSSSFFFEGLVFFFCFLVFCFLFFVFWFFVLVFWFFFGFAYFFFCIFFLFLLFFLLNFFSTNKQTPKIFLPSNHPSLSTTTHNTQKKKNRDS